MKKIYILILLSIIMTLLLALNTSSYDDVYQSLDTNFQTAESVFSLKLFESISKNDINIRFVEDCGEVLSYKMYQDGICTKINQEPIFDKKCSVSINKTTDMSQEICIDELVRWVDVESEPYHCEKEIDYVAADSVEKVKLKADKIKLSRCQNGLYGYAIDWIPEILTTEGVKSKPEWAWWNASFTSCKNIQINASQSVLTNFPVLVNISSQYMNNSGYGFVFVNESCENDGTVLSHDRIFYDASYLMAYVKIPATKTSAYNISIYWNNLSNTDFSNPSDTWSEFSGVMHFSEGSGNQTKNSATGAWCNISNAVWGKGKIAHGLYFGRTNSAYVICPQVPISGAGYVTAWVNVTIAAWGGIVSARDTSPSTNYNLNYCDSTTCAPHELFGGYDGSATMADDGITIDLSRWYWSAYGNTGTGGVMFRNGTAVETGTANMIAKNIPLYIGRDGGSNVYLGGMIDEVMILDSYPGQNWISYMYNLVINQSGMITEGSIVLGGGTTPGTPDANISTNATAENTTLAYGQCPSSIAAQMSMWTAVAITVVVTAGGIIIADTIFGGILIVLGGMMTAFIAFYIHGCTGGIAYILGLVAIVIVVLGGKKIMT